MGTFAHSILLLLSLSASAYAGIVELHLSICEPSKARAVAKLGLPDRRGETRDVSYFDTRNLELYSNGLVLRLRVTKKKTQFTVKIQGLTQDWVSDAFLALPGFKCERDRYGGRISESCSLNSSPSAEDVAAALNEARVERLFSREQIEFVQQYYRVPLDLSSVKVLGPVPSQYWKFDANHFDDVLTLEHWTVGPDFEIVELSTRADAQDADRVYDELRAYALEKDLRICQEQSSKTRSTLEYLAERSGQ
ncbi:MAG: hypothetical protein A2603_15135 [Bdellovibrionales bacterium RIFOXYD1_FULL_55_31]|nr:MAG: hypothetical protein A2603_15135 [Bdellovibrionales bacterium RIFOXYD1_FULL_55_31]